MAKHYAESLVLADAKDDDDDHCQYGLGDDKCKELATVEFVWLADNTSSLACKEHALFIHTRDLTPHPYQEHRYEVTYE